MRILKESKNESAEENYFAARCFMRENFPRHNSPSVKIYVTREIIFLPTKSRERELYIQKNIKEYNKKIIILNIYTMISQFLTALYVCELCLRK